MCFPSPACRPPCHEPGSKERVVVAEFIRTFTFDETTTAGTGAAAFDIRTPTDDPSQNFRTRTKTRRPRARPTTTPSSTPTLPIVQPGGAIPFPIPTVTPIGVTYVDEEDRVGLLVPRGVYNVLWSVNPGVGANITLRVNGVAPLTRPTPDGGIPFPYTTLVRGENTPSIVAEHLVEAPLKTNNLLSLVNTGESLFSLGDLPNTRLGDTAVLTQVRVERVGGGSQSQAQQ